MFRDIGLVAKGMKGYTEALTKNSALADSCRRSAIKQPWSQNNRFSIV